jgi:hypothetical protein
MLGAQCTRRLSGPDCCIHMASASLLSAVRGIAGDSGQAAAEVSGPIRVGPVAADGTVRVRLLMALPRHGQIRVAATLTCQLAEVRSLSVLKASFVASNHGEVHMKSSAPPRRNPGLLFAHFMSFVHTILCQH